jgi:hypothetical protein
MLAELNLFLHCGNQQSGKKPFAYWLGAHPSAPWQVVKNDGEEAA